jgi:hypothetical protein
MGSDILLNTKIDYSSWFLCGVFIRSTYGFDNLRKPWQPLSSSYNRPGHQMYALSLATYLISMENLPQVVAAIASGPIAPTLSCLHVADNIQVAGHRLYDPFASWIKI